MIYADSRYATGIIYAAQDARTGRYANSVRRVFPTKTTAFITYTWKANDRLDIIANEFLGTPAYWWKIMDVNPELVDPMNIATGTAVRIPHE
jgi:nucleoid-associated protein YgaU